jgi:hypothetical protein
MGPPEPEPEPEPVPVPVPVPEVPEFLWVELGPPVQLVGPPAVGAGAGPGAVAVGKPAVSKLAAKKSALALHGQLSVGSPQAGRQMSVGTASSAGSTSGGRPPSGSSSSSSTAAGQSKLSARKKRLSLDVASPPAAFSSSFPTPGGVSGSTMSSGQDASFTIATSPGGTPAWVSLSHGIRLTTEGEVGCAAHTTRVGMRARTHRSRWRGGGRGARTHTSHRRLTRRRRRRRLRGWGRCWQDPVRRLDGSAQQR